MTKNSARKRALRRLMEATGKKYTEVFRGAEDLSPEDLARILSWHEVSLGKGRDGRPVSLDLLQGGTLVTGWTGTGKTTLVRSLLKQLPPKEVPWNLYLLNFLKEDLTLEDIPRELRERTLLVHSSLETRASLLALEEEVKERYELMEAQEVTSFKDAPTIFPPLFVVIEEPSLWLPQGVGETPEERLLEVEIFEDCTRVVNVLARLGRGAGVALYLFGQRYPSAIFPRETLLNFSSRVSLGPLDDETYRKIFGENPEEDLTLITRADRGQGLYKHLDEDLTLFQGEWTPAASPRGDSLEGTP